MVNFFQELTIRKILLAAAFSGALIFVLLSYFQPHDGVSQEVVDEIIDPMATDFFFMRNPEIRENLFAQLSIHEIEYWINEDDSIGFYVKDTKEVDRIANVSISVWVTKQ